MKRYEVYVGQEWRGTVEADTEPEARKAAREGGLWRRGEGAATVLQPVPDKTSKVTSRTAMDRTKTGELGRKLRVTLGNNHEYGCDCLSCRPHTY